MTKQQLEVYHHIKHLAEEQVLFLKSRYKMPAGDIIRMYTGQQNDTASYDEAIESIAHFNLQHASKNGFLAS